MIELERMRRKIWLIKEKRHRDVFLVYQPVVDKATYSISLSKYLHEEKEKAGILVITSKCGGITKGVSIFHMKEHIVSYVETKIDLCQLITNSFSVSL